MEQEETDLVSKGGITDVKQFAEKVKSMCEMQDKIKESNVLRKEMADSMNSWKCEVQEYMIEHNVKRCTYGEDDIVINIRTAAGSLSRNSLKLALVNYYGEEKNTADDVFNFICNELGSREVTEIKRKKRKVEKPKKKKS
jgi:hypothetical protein